MHIPKSQFNGCHKSGSERESGTIRVASTERCAKRAKGERSDRGRTRVISREKENGIKSHPLPTPPRPTRRTTSCDVYRAHKGPRPDLRPTERREREREEKKKENMRLALCACVRARARVRMQGERRESALAVDPPWLDLL